MVKKIVKKNSTAIVRRENIFSPSFGFADLPFGIREIEDKYGNFIMKQMLNDCLDDSKNYRSMTKWCLKAGIYPYDLQVLCDKDPMFRRAYNICLDAIGERRENELRDGGPTILAQVMSQYNQVWRKERDERAAQRTNAEGKGTVNMTVNMPNLPPIVSKDSDE